MLHAAIALKRGQHWRALFEINQLTELTIELRALREGLVSKRWRDVDLMERGFRERLTKTQVGVLDHAHLLHSLTASVQALHDECVHIDGSGKPCAEGDFMLDVLDWLADRSE